MKPSLPVLLSVNGGYVDAAGYLALHGLFTTHVTGNFVTLGAALVLGTSGALAKVLALPLFCLVVMAIRLLSVALIAKGLPALRTILGVKVVLLSVGAVLAIAFGPFDSGDGWAALSTGMVLVAAMAIQNAIHRIHMGGLPPTTIMTGNTIQIMIDLADLLRGVPTAAREAIRDASVAHVGQRHGLCGRVCCSGADICQAGHLVFRAAAGHCGVHPVVGGVDCRKKSN